MSFDDDDAATALEEFSDERTVRVSVPVLSVASTITDRTSPPGERDEPILLVVAGSEAGRVYPLTAKPMFVIGRGADCDLRFEDGKLSRKHAFLLRAGGDVVFEDAGSTNGCFVNDRRVPLA